MTEKVSAYQPRCYVLIGEYNLTPFLGDGARVITHKDLYAPVGKWEVAVPDKPYRDPPEDPMGKVVDSFYGLIKPFDYCEIRMARATHEYKEKEPPIVMRGFVRSVTRDETMGPDGRPSRMVVIRGDDYGLFGEIATINALAAATMSQNILAAMRPMTFSIDPNSIADMVPALMLEEMFLNDLMNEQIRKLEGETRDSRIQEIKYDGKVTVGVIPWTVVQSEQGTAWSVMMNFADTPWNELFIEDREDGPYLVYRPTPWRDYETGNLLPNMGQEIKPEDIHLVNTTAGDILDGGATSEQVFDLVRHASYTRTDQQVYNIFWVDVGTPILDTNKALAMAIQSNDSVAWCNQTNWKNSKASIYGPRVLKKPSRQYPAEITVIPGTEHISQVNTSRMNMFDWQIKRREWLARANRDNVMFDQGSLTLRGNEHAKIGGYLNADRGKFWATHYVVQVTHSYIGNREFTTNIGFIRATNWWNRQIEKEPSPYLQEGRKGLYVKSAFGGIAGLAGMAIGAVLSDGDTGMNDGANPFVQDPNNPLDPRNPGYGDVPSDGGGAGGGGGGTGGGGTNPVILYSDPFTLASSSLLFGCDPVALYALVPWTYDEEREIVLARVPQLGFQFGEETNWKVKGLIAVHIINANGSVYPVPQPINGINTQTGEIITSTPFNDCFIEKHVYFTDLSQLLDELGIDRTHFDAIFGNN